MSENKEPIAIKQWTQQPKQQEPALNLLMPLPKVDDYFIQSCYSELQEDPKDRIPLDVPENDFTVQLEEDAEQDEDKEERQTTT